MVAGHISEGKADRASSEVPCLVTFNADEVSVTNGSATSNSCHPQANSACQLTIAGAEAFVVILSGEEIFACQIKTADIP